MNPSSLLQTAVVGIVAAVIAVVVVFFIADAVSGPLMVTPPGGDVAEELPAGAAVFGTIVGGIVGVGLALVSRRLSRPDQVFVGICVVALILYGVFAFSATDSTSTGVWLNIMHLVAAAPIIGLLVRWLTTAAAAPSAASATPE